MRLALLLVVLLTLAAPGCQSTRFADRGAALGAVSGGLAGAAIGNHNGDTAAGAIIGTAVGALAGAAVGDSIDTEIARNNALIEERLGRSLEGAVTVNDVATLWQARLSEDVIITHIRANGVAQPPGAQDLVALGQLGVSDAVIQTLQTTPPPTAARAVVASPRPVVVEEYHYLPPPPPPLWYHGHYHRGPRRSNVHWGFSFGH